MSKMLITQFDHRYFKHLLIAIASDVVEVKFSAALIQYCNFCRVTKEELKYLFQFVKKQQQKLPTDHPNLLFLQGIVSMYREGLTSTKTLNLLERARQAGYPSASTLLGIAYLNSGIPPWLAPPTHPVARLKLWWRNRKGIVPLTTNSLATNESLDAQDVKRAKFLFEEAEKGGDSAAMVQHAYSIFDSPDVDSKHPAYQKALDLYNQAIAQQDIVAQCMKADSLLDRYEKAKQQGNALPLNESDKKEALEVLDKAAKQGVFYAIASKRYFASKGYYPLENKAVDVEEAKRYQRIVRLSAKAPFVKNSMPTLRQLQQQNQGQDPRIDYYVITSLNHKRPFIFWRNKIVRLCKGRDAKTCHELLECIQQDIYLTDSQRRYFEEQIFKVLPLTEFLKDNEFSEFYLAYIDQHIARASSDQDWEYIETLYCHVPFSSPISACVNARLADAYYQAALDAGYSVKEAFEAAKPYHQLTFKAIKSAKKIYKKNFVKEIEKGGFSLSVHQRIYEERQYKAAPTAENENALNALNAVNTCYYQKLSQEANVPVSDHKRVEGTKPKANVSSETVDAATYILKEGLTPVSVLSSHTQSQEKPATSRFFLLALFDTLYQFFQARFTSSVKVDIKTPQTTAWQFFSGKTPKIPFADNVSTLSIPPSKAF